MVGDKAGMSLAKIGAVGLLTAAVAGSAVVVAAWDSLPWSGDEKKCATASATVRSEQPAPDSGDIVSPMLSPDGRHLLYPMREPVLVEVETGKTVRVYDGASVETASFRADGSSFASAQAIDNEEGSTVGVALWNVHSDKAIQVFPVLEPFVEKSKRRGLVRDVAVGPDGKLVAISTLDGSVRLWDVETGLIAAVLKEKSALADGAVYQTSSLAFSPDGKLVALGDNNGQVLVWQTSSRKLAHRFTAPGSGSIELAFSPNSRYLAVREFAHRNPATNRDAWIVELPTQRGVQVPRHAEEPVAAMRFTPDSAAIVTATTHGRVDRTVLADGKTTTLLEICGASRMMVTGDAAVALVGTADKTAFELRTYPLP